MFKLFAFLKKRDDLTMAAFSEYYEQSHVPLIQSLAPAPIAYRRRYLTRENPLGREKDKTIDFDAMTELWFADRDAYRAWMTAISVPAVAEDEEKFLQRDRTRAYTVEEYGEG